MIIITLNCVIDLLFFYRPASSKVKMKIKPQYAVLRLPLEVTTTSLGGDNAFT